MPTNRQDAWSQDEDLLLAEIVLRQIREGGTQLQAFEEVGKQLSRTAAACGFRWNSFVRKKYKSGIELAKKQRKELKSQSQTIPKFTDMNQEESQPVQVEMIEEKREISFEEIIIYLKDLFKQYDHVRSQQYEIKKYQEKMKALEKEVSFLTAGNEKLKKELNTVEQDYKALIEIMERARKMVVLQEEDRQQKVKFQMDKNGNLERVEK